MSTHDQTVDFVELIKSERKDSAKERKELQGAFLNAIQTQTESQNIAMKTLGDRIERQMDGLRLDLRAVTSRIFWIFTVSLLVIASLAGVAVKYKDLALTPTIQDTLADENNDRDREPPVKTTTPKP